MSDTLVIARESFWHFPVLLVVTFYLIAAVALGVFAYGSVPTFELRIAAR